VLELAAGLSRRGAAITRDPRMHYIEVDLPATIDRKRALLARTAEGREVLARPQLVLVGADVLTVDLAALAPKDAPVFVIAEGLAMYLPAGARRELFARIAALGDVQLVFDLVPSSEQPAPGRIGRALEAGMKRFTGGRTFERDARTRADVLEELRRAGFVEARAITPAEVAAAWQLPRAPRPTQTVVFSCATRATSP
jgi:O-methyltransferase involved in polyketide biosynthesis